jgi:hypothetical protein
VNQKPAPKRTGRAMSGRNVPSAAPIQFSVDKKFSSRRLQPLPESSHLKDKRAMNST